MNLEQLDEERERELKTEVELWRILRHSVDPIINHWIIRDDSNFEHDCNPFDWIPMRILCMGWV